MLRKGKIKRVFPGGNTAKGFFSYYDNIIGSDATRFLIIKGGPGVGKSTFMKRIGKEMVERGYDIEFHQCSSDNNSLDGVKIPALNIAIIDGTAPHVVDPKHPGGVDEILNFGDFWNEEGMRENRDKIVEITASLGKLYKRVYRFLGAAKSIRDDMEVIYKEALDIGKFNIALSELKKDIFNELPYSEQEGKTRHLFGSAYAPGGIVDYYETIVETMNSIIFINSSFVEGTSNALSEIASEAVKRGLFVEIYHEPMVETNIETILIPDLDIALTSSIKYKDNNMRIFDIDSFMVSEVLMEYEKLLAEDKVIIEDLISRGLNNVLIAKEKHDALEKFYVPNINFQEVDKFRDSIVRRINKYEEELNK